MVWGPERDGISQHTSSVPGAAAAIFNMTAIHHAFLSQTPSDLFIIFVPHSAGRGLGMRSVPAKCRRPISIVTKGHIHPANAAHECLHRNPGSLLFPGPGKQLFSAKPPLAFPHTKQIAASPPARLVESIEVLFPRRGAPSDIPNTASRGAGDNCCFALDFGTGGSGISEPSPGGCARAAQQVMDPVTFITSDCNFNLCLRAADPLILKQTQPYLYSVFCWFF